MLSQQLFLVILSVALSAIIYRISASPHTTGVPAVIRDPVLRISAILLLGNFVDMASGSYKQFSAPMQDDQVELADDSPAAARQRAKSEWVLLGALVDRLVLILYLAITIITLIRFSSIL
ncbi:hypothetical protein SK128_013719 [Halocaridina rubra]|uniref:Uncharacterized protein n=1 Tax=Halocaridina rubra TaxID=373956 RepID=A0AAN9AH65_HALRR